MAGGTGVQQARWVTGLREGHDGAFEEVFDAYQPPLWSFLVRLTDGQPELAEDLLQETFLRLARSAPGLRQDSNLSGWLFAVAHNLWRSHRRWRWHDRAAQGPDPAPVRRPDDHHALRATIERVDEAVAALSPPLREVAVLMIAEEWTHAEVAAHLALAEDTVRQRLSRARRQIRASLASDI